MAPLSQGFISDTHRQGLAAIWPDGSLQRARFRAIRRTEAIYTGFLPPVFGAAGRPLPVTDSPGARSAAASPRVQTRGGGTCRQDVVIDRRSERCRGEKKTKKRAGSADEQRRFGHHRDRCPPPEVTLADVIPPASELLDHRSGSLLRSLVTVQAASLRASDVTRKRAAPTTHNPACTLHFPLTLSLASEEEGHNVATEAPTDGLSSLFSETKLVVGAPLR